MAKFFQRNIDRRGRVARAIFGAVLVVAGLSLVSLAWWACAVLVAFGLLATFEALRGWCVMRACGVKTRF